MNSPGLDRRKFLKTASCFGVALGTASVGAVHGRSRPARSREPSVRVEYLEIVTHDVDATCATQARVLGVEFGPPEPGLGGARTALLRGGGRIGVRAPLRADEAPVVRPYVLVEDIEAAVEAVRAAGAEIAHPPLEIPGHGTFAIYIQGGIQHGFWQD